MCRNGDELQCYDGAWERTGRSCERNGKISGDVFSELDAGSFCWFDGNAIDVAEIDDLSRISDHPLSKVKNLPCFRFVDAGRQHFIYIQNTCSQPKMITVRWVGRGYQEDLRYRLNRGETRLIKLRGPSGAIIDESSWDFNYGCDAASNIRLDRRVDEDGTMWLIRSTSSKSICFKVDIWENGEHKATSYGIVFPGVILRMYGSLPGITSSAILTSARFEPE